MKLAAILLARVSAFVDVQELSPRNQVSVFSLAATLRERYNFRQSPQTLDDFDVQKNGIHFTSGTLNDINIEAITFFLRGTVIDTRSSTADCDAVLQDLLALLNREAGADVTRVSRRVYQSQITYYADHPLGGISHRLAPVMEWLSPRITDVTGRRYTFEPTKVEFNFDELTTKYTPGRVVVERREETPFSENKYFSSAPLPTDEHLEFLELLDQALA